MEIIHLLVACLTLGAVTAEDDYVVGLSADEIMSMNFDNVLYSQSEDDRTIDEIIAAAGTAKGAAVAAAENQDVNLDMDMIMDPVQYAYEYSDLSQFAGAALANEYYRWPKAIVPYKIKNDYYASQLETIYLGMKMWMEKTCVRFVPAESDEARTTGHTHYIEIFSGSGCYSSVGYRHRSHQVSLKARGCTIPGIVAHELGHTLGLHHEQCRPDRDNYLNIRLDPVDSTKVHNFYKKSGTTNYNMPYDYCSLMHYGATAFGNGRFTIVPKDLDYIGTIGRSHVSGAGLSFTDSTVVNTMYKCNKSVAQTFCPKVTCTQKFSSTLCATLS